MGVATIMLCASGFVDDVGVIYYRFPVIDAMVQVTQVGCKLKDSPDGSTYLM